MTSVQEHEYTRLQVLNPDLDYWMADNSQDVMSRFKVIYNEESSRLKDALRRFLESNSTLEKVEQARRSSVSLMLLQALKECVECEEALLASGSL